MAELVNRKQYNTTVKNNNWDKMDKLADVSRIAKSKLTDEAFELLFEKYKDKFTLE